MADQEYKKDFLQSDTLQDAKDQLAEVYEANPDAVIIVEEEGKECIIEHGKQLNFVPSDIDLPELKNEVKNKVGNETLAKLGFEPIEVLIKEKTPDAGGGSIRAYLPISLKEGDTISISVIAENSSSDFGSVNTFLNDNLSYTSIDIGGREKKTIKATLEAPISIDKPYIYIGGMSADGRDFQYTNLVIVKGDKPLDWEELDEINYSIPYLSKDKAKDYEPKFTVGTGLEMTPDRTLNVKSEDAFIIPSASLEMPTMSVDLFENIKNAIKEGKTIYYILGPTRICVSSYIAVDSDTETRLALVFISGNSSTTYTLVLAKSTKTVTKTTETKNFQNLLTAGKGISIEGDTISCTLDTSPSVVVSKLPDKPESGNEGKLHLVPNSEGKDNNLYDEYLWVGGKWEMVGTAKIDIDFSSLEGKQDQMEIEKVYNVTNDVTTLDAEVGKYYNFVYSVNNQLTINLPTIPQEENPTIKSIVISFLTWNYPALTIKAEAEISYFRGFSIEPNTAYELNLMYNGTKWIVAYGIVD